MPEPVPPETRTFRLLRSAVAATRYTASGRDPWRTRSSGENARPPKRRIVIATWGTGRRSADGDPGAVLEPCVEDGPGRGIEPERAGDVDGRPVERRGGEGRCLDGLEFTAAFDPDVAGAVDHQLRDLRILKHGLEARQERPQMPDPARALHIRPSSRRRQ